LYSFSFGNPSKAQRTLLEQVNQKLDKLNK